MTLIRDIGNLFQNKNILVEIDPLLLPYLKTEDKVTTQRTISFNLYRLIYHIGTIQSRRFAPSNRLKFIDKIDLIEKIYSNSDDFRIRIDDIRQVNGSETLISISEDLGIGISVVIAESLFNTKRSTIQKIYGTVRRPDWKCQLSDNKIFVVEGKGATSIATSKTQEINALEQKTKEPGDIQVASLTVLNENTISTNRYLDPPIENDNMPPELQNHILRAGHYASVFSFLGSSRLSRYYSQMRMRIEGIITSQEQNLKEKVFKELRFNDPTIDFKRQKFVGSFYNIEDHKYMFVGVDKRLLSYQGFISYSEFENDVEEEIQDNVFILFKDGILVIEIINIDIFSNIININDIKNYQDNITIRDIDEMNEISFSKYFEYILGKNGFSNLREQTFTNDMFVDLTATKANNTFYFEFKISKHKSLGRAFLKRISESMRRIDLGKFIIVTNSKLDIEFFDIKDVICINRRKLIQLTKNSKLLTQFIE